MERELLVTGIGGQGVQLATQVLARALTLENKYVLSLGTYGGTMRGGSTDASLVYGDRAISSPPIVASAWSGIALHHRFWEGTRIRLRPQAILIVNRPIFDADIDLSGFNAYGVPAIEIATAQGSALGAAIVLVAAYAGLTGAVGLDALAAAMEQSLPSYRRKHLDTNIAALKAGHAHFPPLCHPAWEVATWEMSAREMASDMTAVA